MSIKTYSQLITLSSFKERFEYLSLHGKVSEETFGCKRHLNQVLYKSAEWREFKRMVAVRDCGCDLGCEDYPIGGPIYVHHINPITPDDIMQRRDCLFDLENVISTSFDTHNAIHYGLVCPDIGTFAVRFENDTCPWR